MSRRVLVVGPAWVGDMIMADVCFQLLSESGAEVHVLAPAWSGPVLARLPNVNAAHALKVGHGQLNWTERKATATALSAYDFDQAVVLPRSLKAALVPWLASIPQRTGFRGELRFGLINDMRAFDRDLLDQTVKRFAALALPKNFEVPTKLPIPRLNIDQNEQARLLAAWGLTDREPLVALMPGAEYGPAKCWPLENFRALAQRLIRNEYQVAVFGGAKDSAAGELIRQDNTALNLCGKTSLTEAIDLIAAASVSVTNDSGLMHMSAAVNVPVVAVYGSTTPAFTPPLIERAQIVQRELDCRPCFKRECPLDHLDCLRGITVDEVYNAAQSFMDSA